MNTYDLISSITTNISAGRPKHVDADYSPRTSVACVLRYSPVAEFTVLLHPLWAQGGGGGECRPLIVAPFNLTAWHGTRTWTWPPVPARRPRTTRKADRHTARSPRWLAWIWLKCSKALSISRLVVTTSTWRPVMMNIEVWCFYQENRNRSFFS